MVGPTGSSGQVLHEEVHRVLELLWRDSGVHAPLDVERLLATHLDVLLEGLKARPALP